MIKRISVTLAIFWSCFVCVEAGAQPTALLKPSAYKASWQRLLLRLGSSFYTAVSENPGDLDSNLIFCAHAYGLSRLPVIAEGIDVRDLAGQLTWIDQRAPAK